MFLGENGMYLPQGEPFDTQWDLLNNVLGSLTALFLRTLAARRRANGSAPEPGPR